MRTKPRWSALWLLLATSLAAQDVRYELRVTDLDKQLATVTATFPTKGKDTDWRPRIVDGGLHGRGRGVRALSGWRGSSKTRAMVADQHDGRMPGRQQEKHLTWPDNSSTILAAQQLDTDALRSGNLSVLQRRLADLGVRGIDRTDQQEVVRAIARRLGFDTRRPSELQLMPIQVRDPSQKEPEEAEEWAPAPKRAAQAPEEPLPSLSVAAPVEEIPGLTVAAETEECPSLTVAAEPAEAPSQEDAAASEDPPSLTVAAEPAEAPSQEDAAASEDLPSLTVAAEPAEAPSQEDAAASEAPPSLTVAAEPAEAPSQEDAAASEDLPSLTVAAETEEPPCLTVSAHPEDLGEPPSTAEADMVSEGGHEPGE